MSDDPDSTLHDLVEAASEFAIYRLDADGRVTSWNSGARRLKGYALREVQGRHFSQFFTPEDRAAGLPERILAAAAADGRVEVEGWRVRRDGTRFWATGVLHAVRSESGELTASPR
jgi:PAS domain S-box-containing protein